MEMSSSVFHQIRPTTVLWELHTSEKHNDNDDIRFDVTFFLQKNICVITYLKINSKVSVIEPLNFFAWKMYLN